MRQYRIVILGSGGIGKTALTVQFVQGIFVEKYDPTIEDFYNKQVEINGEICKLEILDTAGTEQFTAMRDLCMKNGDGFILTYSMCSLATFNELTEIRDQILKVKNTTQVPIILVGNKCDLVGDDRAVSASQGESLAKQFNCSYIEASAKLNINVDKMFLDLVKEIDKKTPRPAVVKPAEKKSNCCQRLFHLFN